MANHYVAITEELSVQEAGKQSKNDDGNSLFETHDLDISEVSRERRAQCLNESNYDKGWCSKGRWKAICCTERESEAQRDTCRMRCYQFSLSLFFISCGLLVSYFTGGLSTIALVYVGEICGGAVLAGGLQLIFRAVKKDTVINGCSWERYASVFGIGGLAGAVTAGIAVGITQAIVGIGNGESTLGQPVLKESVAIGSASSAAGGFLFSAANDAERKFVDTEKVTLAQFARDVVRDAVIGGVIGTLFGLATGGLNGAALESTAASFEGQLLLPFLKKLCSCLTACIVKTSLRSAVDVPLEWMAKRFNKSENLRRTEKDSLIKAYTFQK